MRDFRYFEKFYIRQENLLMDLGRHFLLLIFQKTLVLFSQTRIKDTTFFFLGSINSHVPISGFGTLALSQKTFENPPA
jgi:hypothetical protein